MRRDNLFQHESFVLEKGPSLPIPSMYGIFTYIYHKYQPNVGKYTIRGSYGLGNWEECLGNIGDVVR